MHFHRHVRFYIGLAAGALAGALAYASGFFPPEIVVLLGSDVFFAAYLLLTAWFAMRVTHVELSRRAEEADEGVAFIFLLSAVVAALSLLAVFLVLAQPETHRLSTGLIAAASVPLGWLTVHTLAAFHYATLYYRREATAIGSAPSRGLVFPKTETPGATEFIYFAFVLGMAAQVSDVVVETSSMRRAVLLHSVASFFFNTVLLALAVNAGINFAGGLG